MRIVDIADYFHLRRLVANPLQVLRFRTNRRHGDRLEVQFRTAPPLSLRGGLADFHMFHRIHLRDEYRLKTLPSDPLDCVVDLGANVGVFAAHIASRSRRVFAYEPTPANYAQLEENTRLLDNVLCVQAAVSDRARLLSFFAPTNERQSGTFTYLPVDYHNPTPSFEVEAISLDDLFACHEIERCDLLKIDVEGAEYDIFEGAGDDTLSRIIRIHGEYHDVAGQDPGRRVEDLLALLRSEGFRVDRVPHRHKSNHGMFFARRG